MAFWDLIPTYALAFLAYQIGRNPSLFISSSKPQHKMVSPDSDLPMGKYPAKKHALKVKNYFQSRKSEKKAQSALLIAGGEIEPIKYCDQTKEFRQNRYFFYLTGVNIPGSAVFFDFENDKLTLFLPNVDSDDVMWSGPPLGPEEALEKFDVDEVLYARQLPPFLGKFESCHIYTTDLDNIHDPSVAELLVPSDPDLFYALDEARLTKDEYEIELLRRAAKITDNCHLSVMSALPIEKNEGHFHAEFTYHAIRQGSKHQGYDPICCSGPNCSTLHYVKNDENLENKQSVLIDAGAEWENYTADVTRCFPLSGKFTKEHREIYDTVLKMQTEVMNRIKPGVDWEKLHVLAHRVLIRSFLNLGIFKAGYSEEEIMDRKASLCFFPHGLGHLLGMDTHDVGGHANYEDPDPLLKFLRLRRPLEENMVVTNEPGVYFNPFLIKEFLMKYPKRKEVVNEEVMEKYMYVGGVRIEDDILVTADGFENLTGITSDPEEIEKIVSDGIKKGRSHFHVIN
ncbi:LAQU0S24e00628g1_1 [Lachancea quebecensis]|uniref:LAQU0S24e00628g1_1 n=1 Tax=Lachancea quebecensis TaxID=1654605 RepID=A0A0P1L549_9SACH|nr:LAQU0S24e00628g1_1 [Lachancea quebecensis]